MKTFYRTAECGGRGHQLRCALGESLLVQSSGIAGRGSFVGQRSSQAVTAMA